MIQAHHASASPLYQRQSAPRSRPSQAPLLAIIASVATPDSRASASGCAMKAFSTLPDDAHTSDEDRNALLTDAGFGRVFTDHVVTIRY